MKSTASIQQQKGISLFVVIIIVLLSTLLSLWASRSALFNELIVGNDADYQRAFEAAQALIQDAEFDIKGSRPDGSLCVPLAGSPAVCRVPDASNTVWFPNEDKEVSELLHELSTATTGCKNGICLKRTGNQDFWADTATLTSMIAAGVGARYGQYTGAEKGNVSNTILNNNTAGSGGWYWVEVMPYDPSAGNGAIITSGSNSNLLLNIVPRVVYRITAVARGLKPGTQVVLQSTFVRQKKKD
ncbi:PilX N-terminal domain-containing pilus assembly protein [Acidovorax sp. LjRoot129]|uniref:pilus assembly PilX family protein n=1 Tax=Acidovorax sp. LjRoot129 TaxID=3342260 RepID=UPI003ECF4C15